ncbi:Calcium/calmodulin-dependent protein kinase type I [Coemansia sp. RSA 1813]|nr:Calcium/calmodulin-dependent protein kinase type I [Coemansia sp. RSA 1646]KAJ1771805.1 Calcium/calmodulin-dependent protein kinase type I [Coemansia sp. RSA 1843]KAJ2090770.1 Calcium/calmodulin-dependent protein kinase type I [Coemansia sp. RSA 986]KAJ2216018.1 Calcium/calmodulin-dependent protein kinase type I [Coemansia sp. RSA 487]KAJ2570432.1 Calcium/calmodulin-dependent protein kinase type I [Coemansia sp. RSA 1813]
MGAHETVSKRETHSKETSQQMPTVPCKYRTGRVLGRGTYAVVKELVHIQTEKRYAGKIISKEHMRGHQQVIRNEINILKNLARKHPNIISLIDYFETPHNVYLVMELCTGGELFDHIRCKQVFTESDAAAIVRQIIEGVGFLHAHGIVHRDLKTENCLVRNSAATGEPTVAIADFGMARVLAPDSKNSTRPLTSLCGTPGYMAPEMLLRLGHGKPVDMWAVGVITYFVLSGSNPFTRETPRAENKAVVHCEYSFAPADHWDRISPLAKHFISSLLVYAPERRMTARQALAHPWLRTHTTPMPSPGIAQCPAAQDTTPQAIRRTSAKKNPASSGTISGKIDTHANVFSTNSGVSDSDISCAQNAYTAAAAAAAAEVVAATAGSQADGDQEMTDVQPKNASELSIESELAKFKLAGQQQTQKQAPGSANTSSSGLVLRLRIPQPANQQEALCVDTKRTSDANSEAYTSTTGNTTLTSPAVYPLLQGIGGFSAGATEYTSAQAIPIKNAVLPMQAMYHPLVAVNTGAPPPGNVPPTCLLTPVASITTCPPSFGSETSPPHYNTNFQGM